MRIRNDLVPAIPAYDADFDGGDAPWLWYGGNPVAASAEPWNSAPLLSEYRDRTLKQVYRKNVAGAGGAWELVGRLSARTVTVGAHGQYTTLSEALAAITDAADTNEYLIVVSGEIAETAAITAKSHVNVLFLPGACVTVTSTSTHNAVNFLLVSNSVWAAVDPTKAHIVRTGVVAGASSGVSLSGTDATVILSNLWVKNTTTGSVSCNGFTMSSGNSTLLNCTGIGGAATGGSCHGFNLYNSNPVLTNCTGIGGAAGNNCHGMYLSYNSNPSLTACTGIGGAGGTGCQGFSILGAHPSLLACMGIGGAGGTGCYGLNITTSSKPIILNGRFCGGGTLGAATSATIAASSRAEDTFRPGAAFAYRLVGAYINVTAAAAEGVTLTLRDATGGGGNALSGAINVASTGAKHFPITGHRVITAGNYVYAALSETDSTLAYAIYYQYEKCFGTCYALYDDTNGPVSFQNASFLSNASSPAVYVTNNGDDQSVFLGGVAETGLNDATRQKAFVCQSAWNPGSVYRMTLAGGNTNLTAAAGTANGSNIEV